MNFRQVIRQLGLLLVVLSLAILTAAGWSELRHLQGIAAERATAMALGFAVAIGIVIGAILWFVGKSGDNFFGRKEALLLVALSWLVGAALAGAPYYLWTLVDPAAPAGHPFESVVSCYFEAMSGLTTTGATVLTDVGALPSGLLLWRALTQWLGGLGIVVLFVAVLPTLGVGGKKLFQIEAPGPTSQGVRPQIRGTARLLWVIYLGLTVAQVVALRLAGMPWFESFCHTFATLATGGFGTENASVGAFRSAGIDWIIIVFMLLSGVNFGIYYQVMRRRWDIIWKDPELRLYVAIVLVSTGVVAYAIWGKPLSTTDPDVAYDRLGLWGAIRYAMFQVVSIQTTTGFGTADFDRWEFLPRGWLVALMFVGASAGSTGGGIKVIRCLIAFKVMLAEVERIFQPNVVRTIKVGRLTIDQELRLGTLVYVLGIFALFAAGALALMLLEPAGTITLTTAATACAATLNNVGPGLAAVGPIENFGWFSAPSKLVMSMLMALGRLEVYAIMVLLVPRFWRQE